MKVSRINLYAQHNIIHACSTNNAKTKSTERNHLFGTYVMSVPRCRLSRCIMRCWLDVLLWRRRRVSLFVSLGLFLFAFVIVTWFNCCLMSHLTFCCVICCVILVLFGVLPVVPGVPVEFLCRPYRLQNRRRMIKLFLAIRITHLS